MIKSCNYQLLIKWTTNYFRPLRSLYSSLFFIAMKSEMLSAFLLSIFLVILVGSATLLSNLLSFKQSMAVFLVEIVKP